MAITPGTMLPIANKTDRVVEVFWLDAIMNMLLANIISEKEAFDLMNRVNNWAKNPKIEIKEVKTCWTCGKTPYFCTCNR